MDLTTEQKNNLVKAIKDYEKSVKRLEAAQMDAAEKLASLKTCSQASGSGNDVLSTSYMLLGQEYMKLDRD